MKFHHLGMLACGFLLIAAQDAPPPPPAEGSTFSEAFAEQSNAAKAAQTAEDLDEPEAAAAAPAPEEPATAGVPRLGKGAAVTREFLIGVWAEPGKSCAAGIDFQPDGKMIGPFPRWELSEGELTMVGNRQTMRLTVVDSNTIQSRRSESDPPRLLKRCPKAPPPPQS